SPTGDTTQSITVSTSGLYVVTVTNEFGCEADAAGVVVTVNPLPVPTIQATGDGMLCAGETITLSTGLFNSYEWSTGDTTQSIVVDTTGFYSVSVTNSFGCLGTSNDFEVTQHPLPEISIEADGPTTICEGAELVLSAIGNGPYLWSTGATTQSITVSDEGIYFVQATDTVTGCTGVSDDVVIEFFPALDPEITADGATAFCDGGEVVLTVTTGSSYTWSTGDTTQSITVTESGVYSVVVVDENGCTGSASQTVTVLPSPTTQVIPSSEFPYCDGDVVTLTALGIPFIDDFEWNTGETSQSIDVTQSGVYTVTVTNPFGCTATASLPIGFLPLPPAVINVDGPSSICSGDEVTLTAIGLPFGNDYLWSNGETTQSITVSEAGTYTVTVTSISGCSATSEPVTIDVVPGPSANAGEDVVICIGDSVTLTGIGGQNYTWTPGGVGSSITVSPTDDTMYILEVTNDGCDQVAVDTVWVYTQAYPVAGFTNGETNLGEPVLFTDTSSIPPFESWYWDFGDGNTSELQNPSNDYQEPGEYTVTLVVTTSAGCADTASTVIDVQEFFVITNVLTPNGDDINDYVWITSSLAESIEAKVYNRWGFSVWEGVGKDLRFAGKTTAGVDLEAGTYYYVVVLNYGDEGIRELTGYITLIR
ncbi:MAG: PKD domain-containing protein, partial [Bacteroidetes bacterium]